MLCTHILNLTIYKNYLLKLQKFYKHFLRHLFGSRGRSTCTVFVLYKLILYFLEKDKQMVLNPTKSILSPT